MAHRNRTTCCRSTPRCQNCPLLPPRQDRQRAKKADGENGTARRG